MQLNKVDVDVAAARADVAQREKRIYDLQRSINTAPEVEAELGRLNRDYGVTKANYEALLERLQRARLSESAEETGVVNFQVLEPPASKLTPVAPNRILMLIAVLLASLGGGAAVAYLMHQMRPVFANPGSLGDQTKLPVFGTVSIGRSEAFQAALRTSTLRFGFACGGLLVLFAVAVVFCDQSASLLQKVVA
jgi:hypothetical protein